MENPDQSNKDILEVIQTSLSKAKGVHFKKPGEGNPIGAIVLAFKEIEQGKEGYNLIKRHFQTFDLRFEIHLQSKKLDLFLIVLKTKEEICIKDLPYSDFEWKYFSQKKDWARAIIDFAIKPDAYSINYKRTEGDWVSIDGLRIRHSE